MNIRLASNITTDSIVDGDGLRVVIWTQGCRHNCKGCHNKSTHDFNGGILVDTKDIMKKLDNLTIERGVTFSGGDPFEQPKACAEIAQYAKDLGLDVWAYTGYTYEQLIEIGTEQNEDILDFLSYIDVLVDGPFILSQKDLTLKYRGSANQRIIDVPKTLKVGKVILASKYYENFSVEKLFQDVI